MPARTHDEQRLRWTVAADVMLVRRVRQRVARWMIEADVPASIRDDAVLVVSELLTNAIDASEGPASEVRLDLLHTPTGCRIRVADRGPGFPPKPFTGRPDGGRGLVVVRRLATEVDVRRRAGGWTVVSALVPAPSALTSGITPPGSARSDR